MHDEVAGQADSRIDLNRAGTPLLEIVSQPDMRSPAEAKAYLTELKLLLTYLGVSDCNMQEGSLRVDANINLHIDTPDGQSRHADRRSQEHEQLPGRRKGDGVRSRRGISKSGRRPARSWATCRSKPAAGTTSTNITRGQRHKEESSDYRYFPDPDLVPVTRRRPKRSKRCGPRWANCRPLCATGLETTYGITPYDSDVLVNQGQRAGRLFRRPGRRGRRRQAGQQLGAARRAADRSRSNRSTIDRVRRRDAGRAPGRTAGRGARTARLDTSRARELLVEMLATGRSAAEVIAGPRHRQGRRERAVRPGRGIAWRPIPRSWPTFKAGKLQAAGNLIGQAKKQNPNVNPGRFREIVIELVAEALDSRLQTSGLRTRRPGGSCETTASSGRSNWPTR